MSLMDLEARSKKQLAHPDTSTIVVLGVVGLFAFPLAFCAWYFGKRLLKKYDEQPDRWAHRGLVEAGVILGIVGLAIGVVGLVASALFAI